MTRPVECPFENEIVRVAMEGRWPDSAPLDLREHAADCPGCLDLVEVASAVSDDRAAAFREVDLPAAGLVWWRMQLRRRREAEQTLQRATFALQTTMVVLVLAAAAALLHFVPIPSIGWPGWLLESVGSAGRIDAIVRAVLHWGTPVLLGAVAWITLAPVAAWIALEHD